MTGFYTPLKFSGYFELPGSRGLYYPVFEGIAIWVFLPLGDAGCHALQDLTICQEV